MSEQPYPGDSRQADQGRRRGLIAALAYANFVAGLAVYFVEKEDEELRFHGMQSALLTALKVVLLAAGYVGMLVFLFSQMSGFAPGQDPAVPELPPAFFGLVVSWVLFYLVFLILFLVRVIFAILGYQLRHPRLPLLGRLAERLARA